MERRNQVFQRLKPPCVALSQAALALNGPSGDIAVVADRLENLKHELSTVLATSYALDDKLADYVFFPLSQVLKASQKVSIRCLELTLQCLAILINHGWRTRINTQLAAQIIILCTLMAEKNPKGLASSQSTEELRANSLWCLHYLFSVIRNAPEAKASLTAEANFPQLGSTITTILDAVLDCESVEGQSAAIGALDVLVKTAMSRQAQVAFLPGIASKLTKVLTPQTAQRRNHSVLVGALDILSALFSNTFPENAVMEFTGRTHTGGSATSNDKWKEIAATQLKPALTAILRLKDHSRLDVKEAVAQLCFVIIKEARKALVNCVPEALDAILTLASEPSGDAIKFRIEALVTSDHAVSASAQEILYNWAQSLTTEMQAADDHVKLLRLQQIRVGYEILASSDANMSSIDRTIVGVIHDCAAITLRASKLKHQESAIVPVQSLDLSVPSNLRDFKDFKTDLVGTKGYQVVIDAIKQLLVTIQNTSRLSTFTAEYARSLHQPYGDTQLATFWLLLNATEAAWQQDDTIDTFLNVDGPTSKAYTEQLEMLYSFSLDVLNSTVETYDDPRFRALALRTLSVRARKAGEEFRFELIDALYPVLHTLATPNEQLQMDSITTLNIFTEVCGYSSVKSLIVENVDYLTNAVALKLNVFDVSPQAPQVLLMMVRLAGSSLLPYLEDTIESIFAALEDYHGYPLLVELLFRVLSVVVDEGTKTPQLAIRGKASAELQHLLVLQNQFTTMSDLAQILEERQEEKSQSRFATDHTLEPHPKRPWGEANDGNGTMDSTSEKSGHEEEDMSVEDENIPPPAPKTYNLLLKISDLTQHFLPSASVSLRSSLLMLLKTSIPALSQHQNSFLPLINTLWPEITTRLDDTEPQILATTLEVIGLLCEHAGDFLRSRILKVWPRLVEIQQATICDIIQVRPIKASQKHLGKSKSLCLESAHLQQARLQMKSHPTAYHNVSAHLTWKALVSAVTAAVSFVGLPADYFDEALEMMQSMLDDEEVRNAFERENADAVWLLRRCRDISPAPNSPVCPSGHHFAPIPV